MGQWGTIAKAPATGIGYSYYPSVFEDAGKVYCKAQGSYIVNIFDTATDVWSSVNMPTSTDPAGAGGSYSGNPNYLESCPVRHELAWVAGGFLWHFYCGNPNNYKPTLDKLNLTTGARITSAVYFDSLLGANSSVSATLGHGNWGRNRHKQVVKDAVSGRIFLINFYMKQIYEFIAATSSLVLVKTWSEGIGGNSTTDIAGCDAVALNGKIYLLGAHLSTPNNIFAATGPVAVNITSWATETLAAYPDYANQVSFTNNAFIDTAWFTVGNAIYGYGGGIYSWQVNNYDGAGVNSLRKIKFNPTDGATGTWYDLGVIPSALTYASSASSPTTGSAIIIAGYDAGVASQATRSFEYILEAPTAFAAVYNPILQRVELSWTDNCAEEAYYIVTRKRDDEAVFTQLAELPANTTAYFDTNVSISSHYYTYQIWCGAVL
jgi:hypothetical protein